MFSSVLVGTGEYMYKVKTLEEMLQTWNSGLSIRELDHPDVDSVMYKGEHVCSIAKGGKYRPWSAFMSGVFRKDGPSTKSGTKHRTMKGLIMTLMRKGIIRRSPNQEYMNSIDGGTLSIMKAAAADKKSERNAKKFW